MADERDVLICPMNPLPQVGERTRKRLEAALGRMVNDGYEPIFECYICFDTGYTSRKAVVPFGDECTFAKPCQGTEQTACRMGLPIEAGLWAKAMKARRGEKGPPPQVLRRFLECLRNHPHGNALRARVEDIEAHGERERGASA